MVSTRKSVCTVLWLWYIGHQDTLNGIKKELTFACASFRGDTDASEWSQRLSDVLRSVEVNVVTNEECSQAKGYVGWFNYESYEGSITSNMLCAQDTNQDSCQGDSGT